MPPKKRTVEMVRFRATDDDVRIMKKMSKATGLDRTSVIRLALRRLEDAEETKKQ